MSMSETKVRVWDLPVRVFHWLLIPLIAFSWWSAEEGRLDWHRLSGYAVLTLIVFRLVWGLIGSETARFARFLKGLRGIANYVGKKSDGPTLGHNPLGGWSVFAMLFLLAAQVTLGLFAIDVDGIESGPLAVFVTFDQGRVAAEIHHFIFNVLLALIGLHVLAILYYALFGRQNLVGPMITGRKSVAASPAQTPALAPLWLALIVLGASAALAYAASKAFWSF
jgi:cytochrome b